MQLSFNAAAVRVTHTKSCKISTDLFDEKATVRENFKCETGAEIELRLRTSHQSAALVSTFLVDRYRPNTGLCNQYTSMTRRIQAAAFY